MRENADYSVGSMLVERKTTERPGMQLVDMPRDEWRKIKRMRRAFDFFLLIPGFMAYLAYPLFVGDEQDQIDEASNVQPVP
jgi:hypothetical protein